MHEFIQNKPLKNSQYENRNNSKSRNREPRIQAYSKSQLAGLYLPHIQSASARRTLRSWIAKNTALQAALAQTGYSEKAILLTPAQVGLFFKFLGEP